MFLSLEYHMHCYVVLSKLSSDFWHNAFIFNQVDAFFLKIAFVCDIYVCMSTPEAVNS